MKFRFNHERLGVVELRTRHNYGKVKISLRSDAVEVLVDDRFMDKFYPVMDDKYVGEILKLKNRVASQPNTNEYMRLLAIGDRIECCNFQIVIAQTNLKSVDTYTAKKSDDCWHLLLPFGVDINEQRVQTTVKNLIQRILTNEAKFNLPSRIKSLSEKCGLQYSSVKINSAKQRWGSCSSKKAINLSCYLMLLSDDLIDYVIVHELCHTVEMNHSVRFKQLWYSFFANYQELESKLNKMSRAVNYLQS